MPILSQLLLDSLRRRQEQNQLMEMRARLGPHVQGLMGASPQLEALPAGQMGPPEITDRGSGLLANPRGLEEQLRFGAGLMAEPALVQPGSQLIQQALRQAQQREQAQQDQALQRELQAARLEQQGTEYERTYNQRDYWRTVENSRAQQAADLQLVGGRPGEGMAVGFLPNGQPIHYGVQGGKPWRTARGRLENAEEGVDIFDELIGRIEKVGSENFGKEAARLDVLYGEAVAKVFERRNLGTPQAGELERVESELRSHKGLKNLGRKGTVLASLRMARELFRRSLLADRAEFRFWPGLERFFASDYARSSFVPPGTVPYTGQSRGTPVPRAERLTAPSGTVTQGLGPPVAVERRPLP